MWSYNYTNELYHYGVKGMRWGVRRTDEELGRKPDNEKRKVKKTHREKLQAKYEAKGFSKDDAKRLTENRIKTEKILAITAGVTLAAATAYVARNQLKYRVDSYIKEGASLQRIAETNKTSLNGNLYTSYNKKDNIKYRGILGLGRLDDSGNVQKMNLKATSKIKVASRKHAEDAFIELFKNDKEFRKNASDTINIAKGLAMPGSTHDVIDKAIKNPNAIKDKELRKTVYDAFNIGLALKTDEAKKSSEAFYKTLSKKGYDAIRDINDMQYSGYKSKAPTIIFNTANKIKVDSIEQLTKQMVEADVVKAKNIIKGQIKTEKILSDLKEYSKIAGGTTVLTVTSGNIANMKAIEKYRRDHPNSRLSDKEILAVLKKK